jgi:hypothetical protein
VAEEGPKVYKGMESFLGGDPDWLVFKTLKYQEDLSAGTLVFKNSKVHERMALVVGIGW